MADLGQSDLLGVLTGRLEERGHKPLSKKEDEPEFDPDLLPDEQDVGAKKFEDDGLVKQMKDEISIIEAYNRLVGKGNVETPHGRTESIMIRCPDPAHHDSNPSAWINSEKDTYYCGACNEGGDIFHLAALAFGFPVPGYKQDFGKLKDRMASEFGYTVVKSGGTTYMERTEAEDVRDTGSPEPGPEPDTEQEDEPEPQPEHEPETSAIAKFRKDFVAPEAPEIPETEHSADVISIVPREGDEDAEPVTPSINWRELLPSGTFMRKWMEVTCKDDLPEEYYFWLGMMSVGLAVNNNMALADNPPVKPNLFVVLYGQTGIGKSRATNTTLALLREAFPWEDQTGIYQVPSPGSAEALIDAFCHTAKDGEEKEQNIPTTGLIRFDELSTLMGRAERIGSAMKPTMMEFYDSYNPVTHKTRGHGLVEAHGHFASAITTTQPKAIRDILTQTDADAGFVNRWLFATGVPKTPVAFGRDDIDYDRCVPLLKDIGEWSINEKADATVKTSSSGIRWGAIDLEPDALSLWEEFFYDELVPTKKDDNTALLSRLDLTMKKVIALLAFDRKHIKVQIQDVEDAITLWEYLTKSYTMLSREIGVGVFEDCRHAVTDIVKAHHRRTKIHATARDILRGIGSRFSSSLVKSVLETLVSLGELKEFSPPAEEGQRKAPRYAYVE